MPGLTAKWPDETRLLNEFTKSKPGRENKYGQVAGGATDLLAELYGRPGLRAGALVLLEEQTARWRL